MKFIHSDLKIASYDYDGNFKYWHCSNKKCLRTLNLFIPGYCFEIFESMIIVYQASVGLGLFKINGKLLKEIKAADEMKECFSMKIHVDLKQKLLLYCGDDYIIIRNIDKNFEINSKIQKLERNFCCLLPFYNFNSRRLELIVTDFVDSVYIYEMEGFGEINKSIMKSEKCATNFVYWRNFLIFGFGFELTFYQIKKEGIFPYFAILCNDLVVTVNVYEDNDDTHLNVIVTITNTEIWHYRINFR